MIAINLKFAGLALAAALATSAATLVATGAPAVASTPIVVEGSPAPSARISHADLNLVSTAGVRRLNARIRNAAERLCVDEYSRSLRDIADGRACLRVTLERARPQVERAIALHAAAQTGAGSK